MNKSEIKQLATNTESIRNIEGDIKEIKKQVTNCIPTQLRKLDDKIIQSNKETDTRIDDLRLEVGKSAVKTGLVLGGVMTVVISVIGAIIVFIIQKALG